MSIFILGDRHKRCLLQQKQTLQRDWTHSGLSWLPRDQHPGPSPWALLLPADLCACRHVFWGPSWETGQYRQGGGGFAVALGETVPQRACSPVPTAEGCVWSPALGLRHLTLQGPPGEPRGRGVREAQAQLRGVSCPCHLLLPHLPARLQPWSEALKCRQEVLALASGGQSQPRCHPHEDHSSPTPASTRTPTPGAETGWLYF